MGLQRLSEEEKGNLVFTHLSACALGFLIALAISLRACTADVTVTSKKEFIVGKSSYRCMKTNELLGKKNDFKK